MTAVIVTRTQPGADDTAKRLSEKGWEAVISPALEIEPVRNWRPDLKGVQAVTFSSANGVRAFAEASDERAIPVVAVGDATAAAAREAGFTKVHAAGGEVSSLAAMIRSLFSASDGDILHISGEHVAGELAGPLQAAGFDVRREVAYEAVPAKDLSPDALDAFLEDDELPVVLFHSARGAQVYARLMDEMGLKEEKAQTPAIAISKSAAEAAQRAGWTLCRAADAPNDLAMIELIARARDDARSGSAPAGGASQIKETVVKAEWGPGYSVASGAAAGAMASGKPSAPAPAPETKPAPAPAPAPAAAPAPTPAPAAETRIETRETPGAGVTGKPVDLAAEHERGGERVMGEPPEIEDDEEYEAAWTFGPAAWLASLFVAGAIGVAAWLVWQANRAPSDTVLAAGAETPAPTPTPTPTPTPLATPGASPAAGATPSPVPTPQPSPAAAEGEAAGAAGTEGPAMTTALAGAELQALQGALADAASKADANTARLDTLLRRIEAAEGDAADLYAKLDDRVSDLELRLAAITEGAPVQAAPREEPAAGERLAAMEAAGALDERIGQIESAVARLDQRLGVSPTEAEADKANQALEAAFLMQGRLDEALNRLSALEATSQNQSLSQAGALAVAALTEAARGERPFSGQLDRALALRPGDPDLEALAGYAPHGAPTLDTLRARFESTEMAALRERAKQTSPGGLASMVDVFGDGMVTRKIEPDGDDPASRLASARIALNQDDLQRAVDAASRFVGPGSDKLDPWLDDARARLAIDAHLASLSSKLAKAGDPPDN